MLQAVMRKSVVEPAGRHDDVAIRIDIMDGFSEPLVGQFARGGAQFFGGVSGQLGRWHDGHAARGEVGRERKITRAAALGEAYAVQVAHGALHLRGHAHGAVAGGGAREGREFLAEARVLGADVYSAIYAARLLAAMLRSRRPLPRGASALEAQLALLDWLPAMRRGERALGLEVLRGCSAKRLGKQLGEMVAELSAK